MGNDYILKSVRTASIVGTSAFVAGTVIENDKFQDELIILVDFTKGSLTNLSIKVEFSPDNTNWYQETGLTYTSGTNAIKALAHVIDASGSFRLAPIKIKDRFIKISALGAGTGTGSSLAINAIIGQEV